MRDTAGPALALRGVVKRYGARAVVRDVSLDALPGEIHAIVGENGAGKSTLMKIAYGEVRADEGKIVIRGVEVPLGGHSPGGAIGRALGMVHQHFMLVPTLSVVENVVLGREPRRGGTLDLGRVADEIAALSARLSLAVAPDRQVGELSVGEQQRVEIVKVLWRGAEVLLLDEPTAVLTPAEATGLLAVLRRLADEGKAIVLVTHKLDEVEAAADRITVMRRGEVVGRFARGASVDAVARAMVGRELAPPVRTAARRPGAPVLTVRDLVVGREDGGEAVCGISLEVGAGEIVGVAGVLGNGQSELVLALAGLARPRAGSVLLGGHDVTFATPAERFALGLGHVAEDRQRRGLVLDFTATENLILGRQQEFSDRLGVMWRHAAVFAERRIADLDIRPPDPAALAASLSGGNQQKLVVARELSRPGLSCLVAAQPTRGVDIGAAEGIHREILAARAAGVGVLLVSSELSELRALSDRIAVIHRGRLVAMLAAAEAGDEVLGAYMAGVAPAEVAVAP